MYTLSKWARRGCNDLNGIQFGILEIGFANKFRLDSIDMKLLVLFVKVFI